MSFIPHGAARCRRLVVHVQVEFLAKTTVTGGTLVLLDALVELQVHLQASILGKRAVTAWVRTLIRLITGMGPQMSKKSEHALMNRAALLAIFMVLAPEYLMVLLDTVFHAEVVHHEVSAVGDVAFELEHLLVELGALDCGHLEVFGDVVLFDECVTEDLVTR